MIRVRTQSRHHRAWAKYTAALVCTIQAMSSKKKNQVTPKKRKKIRAGTRVRIMEIVNEPYYFAYMQITYYGSKAPFLPEEERGGIVSAPLSYTLRFRILWMEQAPTDTPAIEADVVGSETFIMIFLQERTILLRLPVFKGLLVVFNPRFNSDFFRKPERSTPP